MKTCTINNTTTRFKSTCNLKGSFHISCENTTSKSITCLICNFDCFFHPITRNDGNNRSKNFFVNSNICSFRNVCNYCWVINCSFSFSTINKVPALFNNFCNLFFNFITSRFRHKCSNISFLIKRITNNNFLKPCHNFFFKFFQNFFINNKTLACNTNLTSIVHSSPNNFFCCKVKVSIIKHNESIICTKFQSCVSKMCCTVHINTFSNWNGTCE